MSRVQIRGKLNKRQVIQASAVKTASNNSASFDLGAYTEIAMFLRVTAAAGTSPTLDVTIQVSEDNVNWSTHSAFTQLTGVGNEYKPVTVFGRYIRTSSVIAGTSPSFTYSVDAAAKA